MKKFFIFVAGIGLLAYLATGVTQVQPGERAVVRRFGRVLEYKPKPGLWIGLPWGMDRVDRVPVDFVRRVRVGYRPEEDQAGAPLPPGQLLTGDHNLINIQVILVYSVVEDEVEDYVIQEPERVDEMVQRVGEAALAEWVAERTVDDVLLRDKAHLPKWLAQETQKRIQPYRLGIRIRNEASVAYLYPPDEVKAAFDRVTRALAKIETMRNRAEEEAVATIRQAEQYAFERLELAKAYKTTQKKLAEADAEIFHKRLAKYRELSRNNPDYLAAIWWNEMGQLFAQLKDNGQLDLLDKHLSGDGLDITLFPPMPGK